MMNRRQFALSGLFFLMFVVLIILVRTVDVAAIGPAETSIGLSGVNQAVRDGVGMHPALYKLTQVFGILAILIAAGFAVMGGMQLILRRSIRKVDRTVWLLAGLYAAVLILYVLFEKVIINYRPVLMDGETFPEASFPSSHTMLACTIFLSAAMVVDQYVKQSRLSFLLRALCAALAIATVAGRLIAGVHWFTDILGGVLISASLLFLFSGLLRKE